MNLKVTVLSPPTGGAPANGLGVWLARIAPAKVRGHVTVAIVPDARMRALNRKFRRVDESTDVLSFPSGKRLEGRRQKADKVLSPEPLALSPFLGEIVIAGGVAARQARAMGHPLRAELRILALHGLLHLLGYDHDVDSGQMARVEGRLRRRAGLPDGLIARWS